MKYTAFIKTTLGMMGISETDGVVTDLFFQIMSVKPPDRKHLCWRKRKSRSGNI